MAEYLDNIFTDDDLVSQEFLDAINEKLSDITGYQVSKQNETSDEPIDPLDEVFKKEEVEVIDIKRTIINDLSNEEKVNILRKPRNIASIAIDEVGDIVCKTWGNYYISGNKNNVDTAELINEYLKECEKPINARDLRKFVVGKKTVFEKFADMDLYKGKFDIKGFYENVI